MKRNRIVAYCVALMLVETTYRWNSGNYIPVFKRPILQDDTEVDFVDHAS